jgi:alkylated DNA nucleotide flippase Atl1
VRAVYAGEEAGKAVPGFDWSALHAILEALPVGRWTTCDSLADAVGTTVQTLSAHVASCEQCTNAHRILKSDGSVMPNFASGGAENDRMEMLQAEGALVNRKPDPDRELSSDGLQVLIEQ